MKNQDNICPRCGKDGTRTEVDPNTGQILIVCSNRECHTVKSKGWF